MSQVKDGWDWFAVSTQKGKDSSRTPDQQAEHIERAFARCFQGEDGRACLRYLRGLSIDRTVGPDVPESHLRHLEGQRQLVFHIIALIDRGRAL